MTENDVIYIEGLLKNKIITGPVLELGAGYGGSTCRHILTGQDLKYYATDITASEGIDYVADFECDEILTYFPINAKFNSILILNVLEHTFNPIKILDNATKLLDRNGALIIIAPCIWTLHNYPIDCYRFMPNFFVRYAQIKKMILELKYFEYLGNGLIISNSNSDGEYQFPRPASGFYYWYSRIIHRLFNTFGRGTSSPAHVAIGAVLSLNGRPDEMEE